MKQPRARAHTLLYYRFYMSLSIFKFPLLRTSFLSLFDRHESKVAVGTGCDVSIAGHCCRSIIESAHTALSFPALSQMALDDDSHFTWLHLYQLISIMAHVLKWIDCATMFPYHGSCTLRMQPSWRNHLCRTSKYASSGKHISNISW